MVKRVAMVFGLVFIVVDVLGLIVSGGMQMGDARNPALLVGLFPVNILHNLVHLAFGLWGILAASSYRSAVAFCKLGGFAYLALAAIGIIQPTFFGLMPIGGNDVFLHAVLGAILVLAGFMAKEEAGAAAAAA